MIDVIIKLIFLFLVGHSIADFALQNNIMAKLKNRYNKPDWIPKGQKYVSTWQYWLVAHGLIHGGIVYLISSSVVLGVVETLLHSLIDFLKCENITNPHIDQLLHILCKVGYIVMLIYFLCI